MVAITIDRIKFFDDVKFRVFKKKFLRRNKIQVLVGSFDLPATGLWAQHAYTAPSRSDVVFSQ